MADQVIRIDKQRLKKLYKWKTIRNRIFGIPKMRREDDAITHLNKMNKSGKPECGRGLLRKPKHI